MNTLTAAKAFLLLLLIPGWLTYTDAAKTFTISYLKEWTTRSVINAIAYRHPEQFCPHQMSHRGCR